MMIGDKLRSIREYYGHSQTYVGKSIDVPVRNISNYEDTEEVSGVLSYIFKLCAFYKIPVHEFFIEDDKKLKEKLPDFITPEDAEILKILNTAVDIKMRIEVKKLFVQAMKIVLLKSADKIRHTDEFKALFPDYEYTEQEEKLHSKIAEK